MSYLIVRNIKVQLHVITAIDFNATYVELHKFPHKSAVKSLPSVWNSTQIIFHSYTQTIESFSSQTNYKDTSHFPVLSSVT